MSVETPISIAPPGAHIHFRWVRWLAPPANLFRASGPLIHRKHALSPRPPDSRFPDPRFPSPFLRLCVLRALLLKSSLPSFPYCPILLPRVPRKLFPKKPRFQLRKENDFPLSALLPARRFSFGCPGFIGSSTGKVAAVIEAGCAPRDVDVAVVRPVFPSQGKSVFSKHAMPTINQLVKQGRMNSVRPWEKYRVPQVADYLSFSIGVPILLKMSWSRGKLYKYNDTTRLHDGTTVKTNYGIYVKESELKVIRKKKTKAGGFYGVAFDATNADGSKMSGI